MVQLLSPPKLKYLRVWFVKTKTPKSGTIPADELELFEQPVVRAAIIVTPILKCGKRIKCERCLTKKQSHRRLAAVGAAVGNCTANFSGGFLAFTTEV